MSRSIAREGAGSENPGRFARDTRGGDPENLPAPSSVPRERAGIPEPGPQARRMTFDELFSLMGAGRPEFATEGEGGGERSSSTPEHEAYLARCQEAGQNMTSVITSRCTMCGSAGSVTLASADWDRGAAARREGATIQQCFPMLDQGTREQILTGMHPQCFDRAVGGPA